jgi:mannose-6-phosphate isomerase-like protein (cupin superfamily)
VHAAYYLVQGVGGTMTLEIIKALHGNKAVLFPDAGEFTVPPGNSTLDVSPSLPLFSLTTTQHRYIQLSHDLYHGTFHTPSLIQRILEDSFTSRGCTAIGMGVDGRGALFDSGGEPLPIYERVRQGDVYIASSDARYTIAPERRFMSVEMRIGEGVRETLLQKRQDIESIYDLLREPEPQAGIVSGLSWEINTNHWAGWNSSWFDIDKIADACFPLFSTRGQIHVALNYVEIVGNLPSGEKPHYHNSHVVAMVVDGSGILLYARTGVDQKTGKRTALENVHTIPAHAGDIIVIPRNALHVFDAPRSSLKYVALEIGETPEHVDHQMHHKDVDFGGYAM